MASKKQRDRDFARLIGGLLNKHGYGLTNFDSNDKAMEAALLDFQTSRGLRKTGTGTPETHAALKLPPVAVDVLNDQPAEEGVPMPQLRPEPMAASGEASASVGAELQPAAATLRVGRTGVADELRSRIGETMAEAASEEQRMQDYIAAREQHRQATGSMLGFPSPDKWKPIDELTYGANSP